MEQMNQNNRKDADNPQQKTPSKWKKVFGKGAFVVSCIVIAVLVIGGAFLLSLRLMRGCGKSGKGASQPTPTPEPTPVPSHQVYTVKMDEAPPIDALGLNDGHLEEYGPELLLAENWLDMTRPGMEGFRIIRSAVLGCSYIVEDGQYYRLGEGEDGKGLLDFYLTDLNMDDVPELLYTYHFGANEDTFSKVGWFDFATHRNVTSDFSQRDGFLALIEENGNYILCRADRIVDEDLLTFGLTVTERLGEITEIGGQITLILDPPATTPVPDTVG